MRSDMIQIDNLGNGFEDAVKETKKVAQYNGLNEKETRYLQLCTEEILSLAHSVTGEMQATFWMENQGKQYALHLNTKTVMDKEKREMLLTSASSRKNEAANTFLGWIRDAFERAIAAEAVHDYADEPEDLPEYLDYHPDDPEWDGYEKSVLKQYSDNIKIFIRGGLAEMIVLKDFSRDN